jgi:hypothetical protein
MRDKHEHLEPMWPVCELRSSALDDSWRRPITSQIHLVGGTFSCVQFREVGVARQT